MANIRCVANFRLVTLTDVFSPFLLDIYSANPTIDIGQIEGSLVMGLGYFLSEKEVYDKDTGVLLTDSTWVITEIILLRAHAQVKAHPSVLYILEFFSRVCNHSDRTNLKDF